jgi:ubiquinone/menaquinone biosynthesis C-methylase UbiE
MSFLIASFYDRFMAGAESACLGEWRHQLLARVHGDVLEIGAGTGASLSHYPETVSNLVLAEPDRHMRGVMERHVADREGGVVRVSADCAEQIQADDASFDFVVTFLVCCSVSSLDITLAEIRRVLRPGGQLVFLEHVGAERGTSRRRWQDGVNPVWRPLMGNCHLNRDTEQAMLAAGFRMVDITRESMRKAMQGLMNIRGEYNLPKTCS